MLNRLRPPGKLKYFASYNIYELAKLLGRDFKAVRHDIRLLEQFGLIELISSIKQGRERLRPVVDADKLVITVNL